MITPRPGRCIACWLPPAACLCALARPLVTQTAIVVIRHWKEGHKVTNTARLAGLLLPKLRIYDYGSPRERFDPAVIPPDAWLLFPPDAEHPAARPGVDPPPQTLVVLDGSWSQARRMSHRLRALQHLPRLATQPLSPPPRRIRKPPFIGGMATIEAIARALAVLEGEALAAPLDALFAEQVDRVHALRGYASLTGGGCEQG